METPALVLVPSSPLNPLSSPAFTSKDNSPVSSDSSYTRPPSAYGISVEEDSRRNSAESTIFSIYSMYSERRQTWRKSALANSAFPGAGVVKEHRPRDGSRESAGDTATDEGRLSESIADSFYRGPHSHSVSRQSSSGSGFFAGSAESSSRHHSYNYNQAQAQSQSQSSPANRHIGPFLDAYGGVEPMELPYVERDSLPNRSSPLSLPPSTSVSSNVSSHIAADTHLSMMGRSRSAQSGASWGKYVDLTATDSSQPDLTMLRSSPASGKVHDSTRPTTLDSDEMGQKPTRPPRANPPSPHDHGKSESASTNGHFGLGISSLGSIRGLDAMSSTHESYVTAPQSVESNGSYSTPAQRFRVANPGPPPTPSPPPLVNHASRVSSSSQKALPPSPRPDSGSPSLSHAKRQSIVLTSPPVRPASSTHSSLRGSRAPAVGEEPEAFFVRNTYAHLDVTGVKGDGYEEGIERTRAKLGHDRRSVQLAVKNDAKGEATGEIPEKELEVLSSVDRYGFFVVPSHDRVVILPSAGLAKSLQPITQTNISCAPSPPPVTSMPTPPPVPKDRETRRIAKWARMLEAELRDPGGNVSVWRVRPGKERKLRERVFKGIPDAWRSAAWEVLIGRWVGMQKKQSLDARRLENVLKDLRRDYRSSLDRPSSYDVQIDLDVPRTINGHVLFKTRYGQGQRSLFHTLHSFSLVCEECGYCQGMGPLAATLLCYYEPEKVYANLVHFHDEYEMHNIFLPGFPGLLEAIYVQERITEKMMPTVYASFKKHTISTTSYATKWYITLFANSVPFQTQLRIWDAFLLEGRDVFVIVAVAIIWVLKDHLTSNQASFETVLSLLSSFFVPEDEDALLRWIDRALDDKKLRADMTRWRTEWRALVADKKAGDALL